MHLTFIPTLLLTLLYAITQTSATYVTITELAGARIVDMTTDDGQTHGIYASFGSIDGCRTGGHSFIKEFCLDTPRQRAHVVWTNQPGRKYCLRQTSTWIDNECSCNVLACTPCKKWRYTEVTCNW